MLKGVNNKFPKQLKEKYILLFQIKLKIKIIY
jgi:hypothetical protein